MEICEVKYPDPIFSLPDATYIQIFCLLSTKKPDPGPIFWILDSVYQRQILISYKFPQFLLNSRRNYLKKASRSHLCAISCHSQILKKIRNVYLFLILSYD